MADKEQIERVVDAITIDFASRRGLRHAWDMVDRETKLEIRQDWITIVQKILNPE